MATATIPVYMRVGDDGEEHEIGHIDLDAVQTVVTLDGPPNKVLAAILRGLVDELDPED